MYFYDKRTDETLRRISPAAMYIVTRQRNAWNGTESRQYKGPTSLATTFVAAKRVAEQWRRQGSQFTIQEIPGLVIASDETSFALVEFHSDDSFAKWYAQPADLMRIGTPIRSLLDSKLGPGYRSAWLLPRPSLSSLVFRRLTDDEEVTTFDSGKAFRAWVSIFEGADAAIRWVEKPGRHLPQGTLRVVDEFEALNGLANG